MCPIDRRVHPKCQTVDRSQYRGFQRHRPDRLEALAPTACHTTGSPSCGRTPLSGGRRRATDRGSGGDLPRRLHPGEPRHEHFSSAKKATFIWDLEADDLAQQQLLMLNMDPPLHTRYRRLVNKGFTPKMVNQLHERINDAADRIIDSVIEDGKADFVTDMAAELPLVVIAELLGVPNEDRHLVFDWSNRMIGNQDPEYQTGEEVPQQAAMELYAYASALFAAKRGDPHDDLMSVLTSVDIDGEKLSDIELELFFLLLTVAGNETTRNLISGGMAAFFDNLDQWELLRNDRSLLPSAVEEMLRMSRR